MAKVKGTAVSASATYLKERLGEEVYLQVVNDLSPEGQKLFGGVVLTSGWYEFSLLLELMKKVEAKLPRGARPLAWEMGRYSAESGIKTVYKIFFRVADVGFILKRASNIFSNYYDSGVMTVENQERNGASVVVRGFDQPCPYFCDRVLGWVERLLELTGVKNVRVDHPKCRVRGDDRCEFRGRWD